MLRQVTTGAHFYGATTGHTGVPDWAHMHELMCVKNQGGVVYQGINLDKKLCIKYCDPAKVHQAIWALNDPVAAFTHTHNRIIKNPGTHSPMLCVAVIFKGTCPPALLFRLFRYNGVIPHRMGFYYSGIWPNRVGRDVPFDLPGTNPGDVTFLPVNL